MSINRVCTSYIFLGFSNRLIQTLFYSSAVQLNFSPPCVRTHWRTPACQLHSQVMKIEFFLPPMISFFKSFSQSFWEHVSPKLNCWDLGGCRRISNVNKKVNLKCNMMIKESQYTVSKVCLWCMSLLSEHIQALLVHPWTSVDMNACLHCMSVGFVCVVWCVLYPDV